jgi:hypothetical protein|mmetsp:Transcript_83025/g.130984  ORF Transcript_83025/g.130984 Transcript_83025/m.130984 type:complete len:443 (-) Transcript_83025:79-1407(-)
MSKNGAKSSGLDFSHLDAKGKKEKSQRAAVEPKDRKRDVEEAARRRSKGKEPKVTWRQKAPGIAALVFMFGVSIMSFLSTIFGAITGNGITFLKVQDTAKLKEVLFSGEPWLVYCVNNETQSQRLPKVLEDSAWDLNRNIGLRVGVLDCWEKTDSGRSIAQRFKLRSSPPLTFLVANGNKPRPMGLQGVSKAEDIEKKAKPALVLEPYRIDSLKKWPSLCTSRRACIVIGHKNTAQRDAALNVIKPLMESNRALKIVTLDTSFWALKLDDGVLKTRPKQEKGSYRADVLCLARNEIPKEGNGTHSGAFLQDLDSRSASQFLADCGQRSDLVKIGVPPKIKARPSKPKTVTVPPRTTAPPKQAPSPQPRKDPRSAGGNSGRKVDKFGSRESLEAAAAEEALFEAVDEQEESDDEETSEQDEGDSNDDANSGDEAEDEDEEVEL